MTIRILAVKIGSEKDVVAARQRARHIARLCGFAGQDQIRVATSVSELARNAFEYAGGGLVRFAIEGETAPQTLVIHIDDEGPGIAQLDAILAGRYVSPTGMGKGLLGARRLMDRLDIDTQPGKGTQIRAQKRFPPQAQVITPTSSTKLFAALATLPDDVTIREVLHQNQELLDALAELKSKQDDLLQLTQELEDTNRGVVALYAELDEKAHRLRQADTTKSRFLSNISHELRTPLSSIRALAKLLLERVDGELSPEQEKQVTFILQAALTLSDLVNDLLDIAKIEAGKVDVRPTRLDVAELFSALRGMLRPLLVSDSIKLVFVEPPAPLQLYCDEPKLSQILRNFISNALKYTEVGTITVSAVEAPDNQEVIFSVTDTGIGIAPDHLELIFEEFSQVEHPLQRKVKGTGLGLPLCRNLARLLGAQISVASTPGEGSTFSITLPREYLPPNETEANFARPPPDGRPVLVIDGEANGPERYRQLLHDSEFYPWLAPDPCRAEADWPDQEPAAVILDMSQQQQTAWAWLVELKNDANRREIPVILVAEMDDIRKGRDLGADAHFVKPLDPPRLLTTLRTLSARQSANVTTRPGAT